MIPLPPSPKYLKWLNYAPRPSSLLLWSMEMSFNGLQWPNQGHRWHLGETFLRLQKWTPIREGENPLCINNLRDHLWGWSVNGDPGEEDGVSPTLLNILEDYCKDSDICVSHKYQERHTGWTCGSVLEYSTHLHRVQVPFLTPPGDEVHITTWYPSVLLNSRKWTPPPPNTHSFP